MNLWKSRDELQRASIDSTLIEKLGHFWLIASVDEKIKAFILTSQFFKSLFKEEIWQILDFHNTECEIRKCSHLNKFKWNNTAFDNILKKYKKENFLIDRKYIYLMDKTTYPLEFESIINIEKLFEFNYELFKSYSDRLYVKPKEIIEIVPRDKFLIASQIKVNLEEDKLNKIWRIENESLGRLYKQWIKIF